MGDLQSPASLLGLAAALVRGPAEEPLFSTFLEAFRCATRADQAILAFRPPGRSFEDALHLVAGVESGAGVLLDVYRKYYHPQEPPPRRTLVEGRAYGLHELIDADGLDEFFYRDLVLRAGIGGVRHMRVQEASGVNASLTLSRHGDDLSDAATDLMEAVAPVLREVLGQYVSTERERFAASMTAEAVKRLHFGWIVLDRLGQVLDCDPQCAGLLDVGQMIRRTGSGRLAATSPEVEREIFRALAQVVDSPTARPRALAVCRDPWLDMLLLPMVRRTIASGPAPAAIAYVHGDSWRSADRCEQLAELFALTPSEARFALALSRGMTIAEAATEFGLTSHSARTYSKILYAKMGARGLPDLVRIVLRSVLAVAPDL